MKQHSSAPTISQVMTQEHGFVDHLFQQYASASDPATSHQTFAAFAEYFRDHMRLENDFLFPRFNALMKFPEAEGPTVLLYADHAKMEQVLVKIEEEQKRNDPIIMDRLRLRLQRYMEQHREHEDALGYHLCDRFIPLDELYEAAEMLRVKLQTVQ